MSVPAFRPSARVTLEGNVTLPVRVRDALGMTGDGWIRFSLNDDGTVVMRFTDSAVEGLAGSIETPPHLVGRDIEDIIDEAMQQWGEEKAREHFGSGEPTQDDRPR